MNGRIVERLLGFLSRIVPTHERDDWIREWRGELAHARRQRRRTASLVASAAEDALRLGLSPRRPGPLVQDLRFALRSLRRNPGYGAVAVLTLALGLGATTAIYSVVNATLVRPLPIEEEERVVILTKIRGERRGPTSAPNFLDWKEASTSFQGLSALQSWSASLTGAGAPLHVTRNRVSADFFETLSVEARLGRTFLPEEDQLGADPVAVLSHELWVTAFGADPAALGRRVEVSGERHTVVGILPEGFRLPPFGAELYVPWIFEADALEARGRNNVWAIGRLARGRTLEHASQEMTAVGARLAKEYPEANEGWSVHVEPIRAFALGSSTESLVLLLGAVGLLLLIACANVANLTLARGLTREAELAVRVSMGAGRARLVRQMLAESLLVAVVGGGVGVFVAAAAVDPIRRLLPARLADIGVVSLDLRVLAFAFGLALVTGTLAGLMPALRLSRKAVGRGGLMASLRRRGDGSRLRHGLATGQFALAATLLVGAGLLLRSLSALYAVDLGMDPRNLASFYVTLPPVEYSTPETAAGGVDRILAELLSVSSVEAAAAVSHLPLSGSRLSSSVVHEGGAGDHRTGGPSAAIRVATPGYFELMGIRTVQGRTFGVQDGSGDSPVAVINEAAARAWWPGEDPVGRWLWYAETGDEPIRRTVIGVVGDVRSSGPPSLAEPEVYQPHHQTTEVWRWFGQGMYFVTHTASGVLEASRIREVLATVDPDLPPYRVGTLEESLDALLATPRVHGTLIAAFAALAVILAGIGIYGVTAFGVRQRTREIGLRLAIGANEGRILGQTLRGGLRTALAGTAIGAGVSLAAGRLFQSILYGVSPVDPVTYLGVGFVLLTVGIVACVVPARRAARTDPMTALRVDA